MSAPAPRSASGLPEAALVEIAQLHCVWRITKGATHTLNNALTALAGLIDAPGSAADADREFDRCTRLARTLVSRHGTRAADGGETELGRALRRLGPLLEDTLGSRFAARLDLPDELLYVGTDPERVELLALVLLFRLTDLAPTGGRLRLAAAPGDKPDTALLHLDLHAEALPEAAADEVLDPAATPSLTAGFALEAAWRIVGACGGSLDARPLPGGLRLRVLFPLLD